MVFRLRRRPLLFPTLVFFFAVTVVVATGFGTSTLPLYATRVGPTDLVVAGALAGVAAGESRYVRWADLRGLPTHILKLTGEFVPGEQEVTVVFLSDVWHALPVDPQADTVLATCGDGYASVYRADFIARCRPFLVLEINGQGPEHWPPPGLKFNPAPYVISVAPSVAPAVAQVLDVGHKKPWGVSAIEIARFADRFRGTFTGRWASISARAAEGRDIWVNSCASCHPGPAGIFGGTKSGQPFPVIAAIAGYDPGLFRRYVRAPKSENPSAKMEPHPHYTDAQLDALIAFISAEPAK